MTTLQEACSTFASGARSDALRKLIADPKARRIRLEGLEGERAWRCSSHPSA